MFTLTLKSELGDNLGGDKVPFADNNASEPTPHIDISTLPKSRVEEIRATKEQ